MAGALAATTAFGRDVVLAQAHSYAPSGSAASSEQAGRRLDIPAGALSEALTQFEKLTGVKLDIQIPSDAIGVLQSPGSRSALTNRQLLDALLEGTGLTARFVDETHAIVRFQTAAESVEVTGAARTVSSAKFTAPLRDIPQTINVLKSDLLRQQGATTLRDALRNVTGITFQAGEGGTPAGDQMTIRGFSARTDMFVDGVRDSGGYSRDTFNLEQVEVAKGPSSAITGRGSTGGSINLVSKTPRLTPSAAASVEFGTADARRATVDLNQPIVGLTGAAFRLNAMATDSGIPGRDVAHDTRWAIAPTVEFGIRTPTRVTAGFLHMSQDNQPDYGVPWVPLTNTALKDYAGGRAPADASNYYGLVNRDYEKIGNDIGTVQVEHNFRSGLNLRNVTRAGMTDRDSIITSPRFLSDTATTIRRTDVKFRDQRDGIAANQTNLTNHFVTGSLQHDVVAGVEFSRETSKNFAKAETGPDNPVSPNTDLYHPDPYARYTGLVARTGAYTDAAAVGSAAYTFDTVSVGKWQASGGLRWDRFAVAYDSIGVTGTHTPLSRTDRMLSGRAGLVYKPTAIGSIYGGYATAFNPSAEGLALTTSTVRLEPEKTRTFELGTKWDLVEERLGVNLALFRTEKTNARTPGINPGDPPTVLAGRQDVNGIEMGASGNITSKWNGVVSYSFMSSSIPESNTAAEIDQSLALTPRHTLNVWTTYEVWQKVRVGGGAQFMDAVFRNAVNTLRVPSYWTVNALAEYDVNAHLTLRVNGNNLGDTDFVDRISGGHYVPGPRRAVIISTGVKF
jgi:catecholate siderophore receptor